jgi:hypothetical protein
VIHALRDRWAAPTQNRGASGTAASVGLDQGTQERRAGTGVSCLGTTATEFSVGNGGSCHLAEHGLESPAPSRAGGTRIQRLLVLEVHSAEHAGLLTERTRRNLSRRKVRHVQAEKPGELVCIDTFYIGKLKGVGKLWQLTACDAASSYGMAKVVSANNAQEAALFLNEVVAVEVARAG